jgi:hypothetical protein
MWHWSWWDLVYPGGALIAIYFAAKYGMKDDKTDKDD